MVSEKRVGVRRVEWGAQFAVARAALAQNRSTPPTAETAVGEEEIEEEVQGAVKCLKHVWIKSEVGCDIIFHMLYYFANSYGKSVPEVISSRSD